MTTLPEPAHINKYPTPGHYTAEQMLAYGKACAESEREAIAKLADASVNADKYPTLTMLALAIRMRGD